MAKGEIFVGRKEELAAFAKVLERPEGEAVLVVGQAGMGKTWLVNRMAQVADNHPDLKCGWVRYEVTPTDSVDSTMTLMMDNAFEAAKVKAGLLEKTPKKAKQFRTLLNLLKGGLGDFAASFKWEPQRPIREQFLEKLNLISKWMPENGRAIFIIDPEKYLQEKSDYAWGIVIRQLPKKIKFIFPQRTKGILVNGEGLNGLDNVVRIPEGELKKFGIEEIGELIDIGIGQKPKLEAEIRESITRSDGVPYASTGTLELITLAGMKAEDFAQNLTREEVVKVQWRQICEGGDDAIKLFEAYAVLEVAVPDDIVEAVSGLKRSKMRKLLANKYLSRLLREEASRRIYHAILADYILGQIGEREKQEYHERAVDAYSEKLREAREKKIRPDALAAMRLAEHVLAAEGTEAFVDAFVNECYSPLTTLGFLDAAMNLSERALGMVEKGSADEAMVSGNLGLIYRRRGELDKAENMHRKSLEIMEKLGDKEGVAISYGNLGLIYQTRGKLDRAEQMHRKALEIDEKIGGLEGMANDYGNLGLIYQRRGELNKAEEMYNKVLEIEEKLGRPDSIANAYGNLGLIYQARGELDKAEETHKKTLEIEEKIGRLEGVAHQYCNLGLIYQRRGELDKAEDMHKRALEIEEKIGRLEGMARQYGNLGGSYMDRGELSKAEEMHRKALEIDEKIGRLEGMANDYGNLGLLYEKRGDIEKAREYWERALDLYKRIGMPHMVRKMKGWIGGLGEGK